MSTDAGGFRSALSSQLPPQGESEEMDAAADGGRNKVPPDTRAVRTRRQHENRTLIYHWPAVQYHRDENIGDPMKKRSNSKAINELNH